MAGTKKATTFKKKKGKTKIVNEFELNEEQELFCQLYSSDEEFFGNGVQSYIEAYNPSRKGNWYNSAMASASRLLRDVKILNRINGLLELRGLNDSFVDKQLELLITQNADYKTKLGSIKEYNKLKQRIIDKSEVDHKGTISLTTLLNGADEEE